MPQRPTLGILRNSPFPARCGICADDLSRVASVANIVQERLMIDPLAPDEGWWGGWVDAVFNVQVSSRTAYIVTPWDIARVIVLDICNRPRPIRNGFYEYLQFGTGHMPRNCQNLRNTVQQAFERDNVPLLGVFPSTAPQFIRAYVTNSADVGKRLIVQGPDSNGKTVLGTDPDTGAPIVGERLYLDLPFKQSAFQYQNVTGFIKDATLGPVQIFAVDAGGTQTLISSMEPNETTASYRRYLINNLPPNCCNSPTGTVQVNTKCKLDFVPVQSDTDYLIIQNIPALIEEGQSWRYSDQDTETAAKLEAKHHAKALALLNGQLDHYQGKTNVAISAPIFGSAKLRPQPR